MFYREFCNRFAQAAREVIAPRLQYSQLLYERVLFNRVQEKQLWLDLGCGRGILPHWRCAQERELTQRVHILVGMDYDLASLKDNKSIVNKVRGDVLRLPFCEACFDVVSANMVFEHLKEPAIQLREIFRVLKPSGEVIFHTPNAWGYGPLLARCVAKIVSDPIKERIIWFLQRRVSEDVFPTFYRINTTTDIQRLASSSGFEVSALHMIVSTPLFTMVPPLLVVELLLIRMLMTKWGRPFRSNIIAILRKPRLDG